MGLKKYILISILLISIKFIIWIICPEPNGDGVWTLSYTFSFIKGDFFHHTFSQYANYPQSVFYPFRGYQIFAAPFYKYLPFDYYNIFIFNILLISFTTWFLFSLIQKKKINHEFGGLIILSYLCSVYTYGLRSELLSIFLLFLLVSKLPLEKDITKKITWFAIIITVSLLIIHPIPAVFATLFFMFYIFENKAEINVPTLYFSGIIICIILLLSPFTIYFNVYDTIIDIWNVNVYNEQHVFTIRMFIKYMINNPVLVFTVIIFFLYTHKNKIVRELIFLIILIITISFFGRSYYFPYLIPYIFWRSQYLQKININREIIFIVIFLAPILTHYLPIFRLIENPDYGSKFKKVLITVDEYTNPHNGLIYVTPQIGMPVIPNENARFFHNHFKSREGYELELTEKDKFLFDNPGDLYHIYRNTNLNERNSRVKTLVSPVKGYLTASSLFTQRSDSLGLWIISYDVKTD